MANVTCFSEQVVAAGYAADLLEDAVIRPEIIWINPREEPPQEEGPPMQHLQKNSLLEAIFRTVEEFTKSRSKGLIHASGFSLAEDSVKLLGKCYPLGKFERPLKEYLPHLGISASVGSGAALTGNPLNSTVSSVFMVAMQQSILEIIRRTSAEIPADVHQAILKSLEAEKKGTISESALKIIDRNIALAKAKSQPICQDTGSIIFYVECPLGFDQITFEEAARTAVTEATRKGYLRQNSVDSLTGVNDGTNVGPGSPTIHFHQHRSPEVSVRLILKGGGCENVGAQYSLPNEKLKANRDLDGCRKVILDAVVQAQGKGCGPGILGVCIGGDRATGYEFSKQQFMRRLDDRNPNPELDKLEQDILHTANELGIGPMGFGGKTTLLGVKICAANRLPASFFVSVSYMCWAYRRQGATLDSQGNIQQWLY